MKTDTCKTAFVPPDGLHEFVRFHFDLSNAPFTFQRLSGSCAGTSQVANVPVYRDDVPVFGKSFEEHQERLNCVERARKSWLNVKQFKMYFRD